MVKIPIDPSAIGQGFAQSFTGLGSQLLLWGGYFFISVIIIGFMWGVYILIQYKYYISLRKLEGGKISAPKWERARVLKDKGIIKWKLLMARKKIMPVDYRYIYSKNKVNLLRTGSDTFIPMEEEVVLQNKNGHIAPVNRLKPVDEDITYWYQLQQQQIAQDYQPDDIAKKQMLIMMGTIIFCLLLCGFTIWLSLKSGQDVATALKQLKETPILQQVAQGIAPK